MRVDSALHWSHFCPKQLLDRAALLACIDQLPNLTLQERAVQQSLTDDDTQGYTTECDSGMISKDRSHAFSRHGSRAGSRASSRRREPSITLDEPGGLCGEEPTAPVHNSTDDVAQRRLQAVGKQAAAALELTAPRSFPTTGLLLQQRGHHGRLQMEPWASCTRKAQEISAAAAAAAAGCADPGGTPPPCPGQSASGHKRSRSSSSDQPLHLSGSDTSVFAAANKRPAVWSELMKPVQPAQMPTTTEPQHQQALGDDDEHLLMLLLESGTASDTAPELSPVQLGRGTDASMATAGSFSNPAGASGRSRVSVAGSSAKATGGTALLVPAPLALAGKAPAAAAPPPPPPLSAGSPTAHTLEAAGAPPHVTLPSSAATSQPRPVGHMPCMLPYTARSTGLPFGCEEHAMGRPLLVPSASAEKRPARPASLLLATGHDTEDMLPMLVSDSDIDLVTPGAAPAALSPVAASGAAELGGYINLSGFPEQQLREGPLGMPSTKGTGSRAPSAGSEQARAQAAAVALGASPFASVQVQTTPPGRCHPQAPTARARSLPLPVSSNTPFMCGAASLSQMPTSVLQACTNTGHGLDPAGGGMQAQQILHQAMQPDADAAEVAAQAREGPLWQMVQAAVRQVLQDDVLGDMQATVREVVQVAMQQLQTHVLAMVADRVS